MQRSMFAILSAIIDRAMASQPSAESPDHEHGQQKRDDHAHADEHIGENDSGAALDGHSVRSVERIADAGSSSSYIRSRGEGEAAVQTAFPGAVIMSAPASGKLGRSSMAS